MFHWHLLNSLTTFISGKLFDEHCHIKTSNYIFLIVLAIFCLCYSAFASAEQASNQVTIVTVERPPYTSDEQNRKGFLSEIVEASFEHAGYQVKRHNLPWARAKLQIISGEADVIFPASYEDVIDINGERVLLHNTLPIVLVKHAQMDDRWNGSLKSLEGKSIASHRGMLISREFNEFSAAEKFEVASTEQLFKLVQLRRVDFAITDWLTAKFMLERKAFKDLVVVSPPHIASSELYLGISSITKNREDIRLGFEDGLAYLK